MANTEAFDALVQQVFSDASSTPLSWVNFGALLDRLKLVAIEGARDLALQGYQKKQLVMDALAAFIDSYLPLPGYLFFLRPYVKQILLALADGAIETLYHKLTPPPTG